MITIRRTRILRGPNIWAPGPVILLTVDIGELEERLERETPVFFERLTAFVPELHDCADTVSQPDGGLRRLLLDRLAVALQRLAGAQLARTREDLAAGAELTVAQTHPAAPRGHYTVVYAYEHSEVGLAAGRLAVRLLNHLLVKSEPGFDFTRELEATVVTPAVRHADRWLTGTVVAAARRRGIPVERLRQHSGSMGDIVQLGNGRYQRRLLSGTITSETAWIAAKIANDKGFTNRLLREAGLPVPRNAVVQTTDEAVRAAGAIGYPVVVKPLDASRGHGVTIDVRGEAEVREVFTLAKQHSRSRQVVVERFIPGTHYRILIINSQIVGVLEHLPAHVIGDGLHSVAELVEIINADPRRGDPDTSLKPITVDTHTRIVLAKQGLRLDEVPDAGRFVKVKQLFQTRTGGSSTDRTADIHPDNAEIARQAALVVGLDVAGIDVITPDIAHSVYVRGGAVLEVNPQPGLRPHVHPAGGTPRDVGMAVIDHLFPPGQSIRVPIVAVTGTNGKTTTTRMITHIMTAAGKTVGMTNSDGLYLAGTHVAAGDMAGAAAARKVLRNPAIDVAVLETARGSILKHGLGFDRCDVAVVTNVAADHLAQDGIHTLADLARVKAVVLRAVVSGGTSVLNADDPMTVAMAEVAGGEIIYFSMSEDSSVVNQHVRQGGRAVVLRRSPAGEALTLLEEGEETAILLAAEIPASMEGRIQVNIANALAATAATIAQDVPVETIRRALRTFQNSFAQTPGRFNVLQIDGRTVLLDYCHNLHGLEALGEFVRRMGASHTVGVINISGNRTDEHITAFGQLAARIFDELVIREPKHKGGHQPEEVSMLLRAAAIAADFSPDKISLTHDEVESADVAIARGGKDSLVIVMVASPAAVWNHLSQRQQAASTNSLPWASPPVDNRAVETGNSSLPGG